MNEEFQHYSFHSIFSEIPSYLDWALFCLVAELHHSPLLHPVQVLQRDHTEAALHCASVLIRPPLQSCALITAAVTEAELVTHPVECESSLFTVRWGPSRPDAKLPNEGLPDVAQLQSWLHSEGQGGWGRGAVRWRTREFLQKPDRAGTGRLCNVLGGQEKGAAWSVVDRKSGGGWYLVIFLDLLVLAVLQHVPVQPLLVLFIHPHRRGSLSSATHGLTLQRRQMKS